MPGLTQRTNEQYQLSNSSFSATHGFWSNNRDDDISYNQLQKFWCELSRPARQELLRIDKQILFEQARKNLYCSRCNGLLLEVFLQIVMYGKSLQQEGAVTFVTCSRSGPLKNQINGGPNTSDGGLDEAQDPSVHPWGGLITSRDGILTLMDCYLYSKSLKGLQNVFDSARARERERELLYPDACGGGGRGWISQGMGTYGSRGHGTRETCALHTARLSCDTLVDFWSALGEETRLSLLKMKEEDFIERLMYRFDSKRFCRDCRRNVIREFKELKELKRTRRETRCTRWYCAADTTFQYEVSEDSVHADWRQTFSDNIGIYDHFEWAIGTGEGKCDILGFQDVGKNQSVQVDGLDLDGLNACYITLKACKHDNKVTELCVKAHALKGQQCVHSRLVVGDGYVTITRGESIRRFFEHAEEAEEEEDDDSVDKDGNEMDGECSRPQKHAKSPELAREFLLDAATVIFKEQVDKAFREGTARQNAHSIFVCLALKLLEERVHVACKEIITLEKQTKLIEEEEKEKREEEERKKRRRTKEREKKLRRKEKLKGKEKDSSDSNQISCPINVSNEDSSPSADNESNSTVISEDPVCEAEDLFSDDYNSKSSQIQNYTYIDCADEESVEIETENNFELSNESENSKYNNQRLKPRKEFQMGPIVNWADRRRQNDHFDPPSRGNGGPPLQRQVRTNGTRSKFNDKFHSCSCNQTVDYRPKIDPSSIRTVRDSKYLNKSESANDDSKQFYRDGGTNNYLRENCGRPNRSKIFKGNNLVYAKKVWEPLDSQKKNLRGNSGSDFALSSSSTTSIVVEGTKTDNFLVESENKRESEEEKDELLLSSNHILSSASNTDNCSSEGKSQDSSVTSDSEDSPERKCEEIISPKVSEQGNVTNAEEKSSSVSSQDHVVVEGNIPPSIPPLMNPQENHYSNQIQYQMFQAAPSNIAYHHQNPVSWPPSNNLMVFPHQTHYLFASPIGYGLNGNSPYCVPYGSFQHVANPLPSQAPASVPHLIPKVTSEGQESKITQETKKEDSEFSIFRRFCGPADLSELRNSTKKGVAAEDRCSYISQDYAEGCSNNKKDTTVEEYNLFANGGLKFTIC